MFIPPKRGTFSGMFTPRGISPIELVEQPDLTETDMHTLATIPGMAGMNVGKRLAQRADLSHETSTLLASAHWPAVREAVAKSPHTPADVLAMLAEDPIEAVRTAARNNPNFPNSGPPGVPWMPTGGRSLR